jgi:hypothetical protein
LAIPPSLLARADEVSNNAVSAEAQNVRLWHDADVHIRQLFGRVTELKQTSNDQVADITIRPASGEK